ncbi:MAG TPA: class III extradiol dioxygenase family protein [Gammaproteobacteria bacterium]|nr:class III extradiol dioxygenase family protein [Gammaproteobacteria bacterium]
MAKLLGAICTSHIPAIGNAIARGKENEPYWRPFFAGYPPIREWLKKVDPAAVVMIYNDHGLSFFLDKMPTFAIGAAPQYRNEDEGWGLPTLPPYTGDPRLSWHMIESLVADEFDVTTCQEMLVDHAFTVPISLLWPERSARRFGTVPVAINTVQHPLPTPARCYAFGQAIGRAIESYPQDIGVVVVATGGMSHQLDGERAGFINKAFDLYCLEKIVADPRALTKMSIHELVREAGTQGVELIMWLAARGALDGNVAQLHRHYHIPVSNTAAGLLLLERAA